MVVKNAQKQGSSQARKRIIPSAIVHDSWYDLDNDLVCVKLLSMLSIYIEIEVRDKPYLIQDGIKIIL